jgi:chromosome segregation ATPase
VSAQLPRLEARISAQEHLTVILHARIEELSQDIDASFDKLAKYQIETERTTAARFDKVDADINEVKAQMASMETRMLDAFQQLITMIDTRLPPRP